MKINENKNKKARKKVKKQSALKYSKYTTKQLLLFLYKFQVPCAGKQSAVFTSIITLA